jgi:hypothetical protein
LTKEGECNFEGSNDSVFGDSCQKGGEMSPKQKDRTQKDRTQKDRTTTNLKKNLVLTIFNWYSIVFKLGRK